MSAATPLGFHARARRYMAASGREWDPHRMSLDQCTPAQRRRLMRKERRSWATAARSGACERQAGIDEDDATFHGDLAYWGDPDDDDVADPLWEVSYPEEPYCVTPGCNCCDYE